MITAMAIVVVLSAATISSLLFGMKMYRVSESKLLITADARNVLNHIRDEIRSAKIIYVGNMAGAKFLPVADGIAQAGSALKVCPTDDTNTFVCYYQDGQDQTLKRFTSADDNPQVTASCVTNQCIFQAEDYQGGPLTHSQNNRVVIKATLQFCRKQYAAAGGDACEQYQLQTRIARRTD
jgi:type II secretory pathway pseudopilin PulG